MSSSSNNTPPPLVGLGREADQGWGAGASPQTASVVPSPQPSPARGDGVAPLLTVTGLRTVFRNRGDDVAAVDGVDISVDRGRTLGIVGESGCGKSVLSLSVMRLVPPPGRIAAGRIEFDGRNLLDLSMAQMRDIRGNRIERIL
jgi:ABC-type multidrug transport system fused ATPase/permease subunit